MYLALRKCKNDCKILKITLVQIFVHLNLKVLDFLSDFVVIVISIVLWKFYHTDFVLHDRDFSFSNAEKNYDR